MRELIATILAAHPDFAGEVEGASPEELDALEAAIGRPLPDAYRAVLELMGRDLGRAAPVWEIRISDGGQTHTEHRPLRSDLAHLKTLHLPRKAGRGRRGVLSVAGRLQIATSPQAQDLGYFYLTLDDDPPRVVHLDCDGVPVSEPVLLHRFFFEGPFRREVAQRLHALGL